MPPRDFTRPRDGFRFRFGGMKLNARPDALPPDKYPIAVNIREYEQGTIRTRPGLGTGANLLAASGGHGMFTDVRAYTALNTGAASRFLARNADDTIWLDTAGGANEGSLAGGGASPGAAMIPFRPNASPQPYMYIANGSDYQKFSAPFTLPLVQQKVGIAEPQVPPDAALATILQSNLLGTTYTQGGTAGAPAGSTRFNDTVGAAVFKDPASGSGSTSNYGVFSLQVSNAASYQRYAQLQIGTFSAVILDVFPVLPTAFLTLSGIFYFSGSTGRCILVISTLHGQSSSESINDPLYIASLRRGAILKIGTENVLVLSVTPGPDNTYAIETSTTNTHTTADTVTLIPAIKITQMQQGGPFVPATGNAIGDQKVAQAYNVTAGVGTETSATITTVPFVGGPVVSTASPFQPDDYISFGFKIDVPANLTEMKLLFDVDDGSFTKNFYYYTVRATDIAGALTNALTQLAISQTVTQRALIDEENAILSGNQGVTFSSAQGPTGVNTWIQIFFPISELTRIGTDQTKSLLNLTKFQVLWNVTGTINVVQDNSFFVWGGFDPDVGDVGAPYLYRVVPYSSTTGAIGNPSPASRYGVSARRQSILVTLPSAAYDPQIDTWYVYRYGGSVTSWRFIGSTPSANTVFTDNFSDDAALGGDEMDSDNFEPWPTIDAPVVLTTAVATVVGTTALVTFSPSVPENTRFLPGTLVRIGTVNVYTLWTRPTAAAGGKFLFQLLENAGAPSGSQEVTIQEPILANQPLPYMWGPDANGHLFACGDPLRPGNLYYCKPNTPDSAPDKFNQEITQPSEPLQGGETVDGVSYVASSLRWWRLYFQPDNPTQRFSPVQEPIDRGLAAPYGHCTDGKQIFFWAEDGIWGTATGSLTDADLYNLFPHEGIEAPTDIVYNAVTIPAPDYTRTGSFRLAYAHGFLYATYLAVSTGAKYNMLVLNLHTGAWCLDVYGGTRGISVVYKEEQPPSSASVINPNLILAGSTGGGTSIGRLYIQTDLANDNTVPIPVSLAVREYDGGDSRAPKQWGDYFVDLVPAPAGGVQVIPMSLGAGVAPAITIPQSFSRSRSPVSVRGITISDFMGLFLSWTDDFSVQPVPTQLFMWQPSFDVQPAKSVAWETFGTSFGLQGYGHIRQVAIAWVSTAAITLTITTVDGQDPQVITLPSSGGAYTKQLFPVSANKGQLFVFQATSTAPFQVFEEDIEIFVGQWGRPGPYLVAKSFGGASDAQSPI